MRVLVGFDGLTTILRQAQDERVGLTTDGLVF